MYTAHPPNAISRSIRPSIHASKICPFLFISPLQPPIVLLRQTDRRTDGRTNTQTNRKTEKQPTNQPNFPNHPDPSQPHVYLLISEPADFLIHPARPDRSSPPPFFFLPRSPYVYARAYAYARSRGFEPASERDAWRMVEGGRWKVEGS